MGINAELRLEGGEVLARADDRRMALARATAGALGGTRLLKYSMPWGDTIFNQAQADDLRDDVRQMMSFHAGTPLSEVLGEIEPLVDRLSTEVHVYLWFVGD